MAEFDPEGALRRVTVAINQASAELARSVAQTRRGGGRRWRRLSRMQRKGLAEASRATAALRSAAADADLGWIKAAAAREIVARPVGAVAAAVAVGFIFGILASR